MTAVLKNEDAEERVIKETVSAGLRFVGSTANLRYFISAVRGKEGGGVLLGRKCR